MEKAAALLQSLATNHALIDGNKRTAFVATALFYELNGHRVPAGPENELFELVIAVATRRLDSVHAIAHELARFVD
ncbi:MAG: type II toxin-antitoxin system death-on-curing family toxin [Mycobacteriaceae bacterium]